MTRIESVALSTDVQPCGGEPGMSPIERYRERHTIVPVGALHPIVDVCAHDGIRVYPRRGGWFHDTDEVRNAAREALPAWPERRVA